MCLMFVGCNEQGNEQSTSEVTTDSIDSTTPDAGTTSGAPDDITTTEKPDDNTTTASPDYGTTSAEPDDDTTTLEPVDPPIPPDHEGSFGKYANGTAGNEDGYVWDAEKKAFVTKSGTDGDSAFLISGGTPLTVDYYFCAEVTFPELIQGGGLYLTARTKDNLYIRFGVEAITTKAISVFSEYANGGKVQNRIRHIASTDYNGPITIGVIVYADTVAMLWGGEMIYERTVDGIMESELVVSGNKHMAAEIRNVKYDDDSARVGTLYDTASASYKAPLIGNIANSSKVTENRDNGTVEIRQKSSNSAKPEFDFYYNGNAVEGEVWAVTGKLRALSSASSGHIFFIGKHDGSNYANLIINRRQEGSNGIWRSIVVNGVRTPAKGNENISNTFVDTTDWSAEFAYIFKNGTVSLYIKEEGEEFQFMTSYETDWDTCTARFQVSQYVDVILSDLEVTIDMFEVESMIKKLDETDKDQPKPLRVLFIGNSATSVNNVPYTFLRLARNAGYNVEITSWTKGGYTLTQHADPTTDYGKTVYHEISREYDMVFIQDNGNCISSAAMREASKEACRALDKAIREAGSKTCIYVRPPYGYANFGYTPFEQCMEFDKLFSEISAELGTTNAYVNRAYAYAMQNLDLQLWGSDNAHTSEYGAYLVVCVIFSTVFETSSQVLDSDGLPADVALTLQQLADKIVLEGYIPW